MGKPTRHQRLLIFLFCLFLFWMGILYLLLPPKSYSELEKRALAPRPDFSAGFPQAVEDYMKDHMPLRRFFLEVNAFFHLLTGRQAQQEIYIGKGGRLLEAPIRDARTDHVDYVNQFQQAAGIPLDLMVVPSAGFVLQDQIAHLHYPYRDGEILQQIRQRLDPEISMVELEALFAAQEDPGQLYYRTDHHWTSLGAFIACNRYFEMLRVEPLQRKDFLISHLPGFYGTTYSRSCLWRTEPESVELWQGRQLAVEGAPGLFVPTDGKDKYQVFLGGNQPVVKLYNPQGQGSILVLRDSYGSCFANFLAQRFEQVLLVDLRYYKKSMLQLCREEKPDRILVLYSIENFLFDKNFTFLQES